MSKSETIETLVRLLAKAEDYNEEHVAGEVEDAATIDELATMLTEMERQVDELQDDNVQLQHSLIDYADQRDVAIRRAQRLEHDLREANEFLTRIADLAADEDWLAIAQSFGLELATESEDGTFIPEYLETEADYESAPVGTEVLYFDHEELDPPTHFHTRVDGGWEDHDSGYVIQPEVLAGHARKVLQWGSR